MREQEDELAWREKMLDEKVEMRRWGDRMSDR